MQLFILLPLLALLFQLKEMYSYIASACIVLVGMISSVAFCLNQEISMVYTRNTAKEQTDFLDYYYSQIVGVGPIYYIGVLSGLYFFSRRRQQLDQVLKTNDLKSNYLLEDPSTGGTHPIGSSSARKEAIYGWVNNIFGVLTILIVSSWTVLFSDSKYREWATFIKTLFFPLSLIFFGKIVFNFVYPDVR